MSHGMRVTRSTIAVLRVFLADPVSRWSGYELSQAAGVGVHVLYPILYRLETAGWLSSQWEAQGPDRPAGPRRRYYQITNTGTEYAVRILGEEEARRPGWRFRLGVAWM